MVSCSVEVMVLAEGGVGPLDAGNLANRGREDFFAQLKIPDRIGGFSFFLGAQVQGLKDLSWVPLRSRVPV